MLIERPARRDYAFVGRGRACAHAAQQGRLKPPAILIPALKVQVRRPGKLGFSGKQSQIADSRLQPYVENVRLLFEFGAAAIWALHARGKNYLCLGSEPGIGSRSGKEFGHLPIDCLVVERLAAILTEKHG